MGSTERIPQIMLVGDCAVGKTALRARVSSYRYSIWCLPIVRQLDDLYVEGHDVTIDKSHSHYLSVGNKLQRFTILDTGGSRGLRHLIKQWIEVSDAFVMVYSVTSRESLSFLSLAYEEILVTKGRKCPTLLVANKGDVPERSVKTFDEENLRQELGCERVEVSAKRSPHANIRRLFDLIAEASFKERKHAEASFKKSERAATNRTINGRSDGALRLGSVKEGWRRLKVRCQLGSSQNIRILSQRLRMRCGISHSVMCENFRCSRSAPAT